MKNIKKIRKILDKQGYKYVINPSSSNYYFIGILGKYDKEVIRQLVIALCGFLTYVDFEFVGKGWIITMKQA